MCDCKMLCNSSQRSGSPGQNVKKASILTKTSSVISHILLAPVGCGKPPSLEGGDVKNSVLFQYRHSESVEYTCQNLYTMSGNSFRTCINGEWIGSMACLSKLQQVFQPDSH